MPTYQFTQDNMPAPAELRELLQAANEQYNPIEELLSLERQLMTLEQKYQMTSAEFYGRYHQGTMDDAVEFVAWAGRYRLYLKLKEAVSNSLNMVLTAGAVVPA